MGLSMFKFPTLSCKFQTDDDDIVVAAAIPLEHRTLAGTCYTWPHICTIWHWRQKYINTFIYTYILNNKVKLTGLSNSYWANTIDLYFLFHKRNLVSLANVKASLYGIHRVFNQWIAAVIRLVWVDKMVIGKWKADQNTGFLPIDFTHRTRATLKLLTGFIMVLSWIT